LHSSSQGASHQNCLRLGTGMFVILSCSDFAYFVLPCCNTWKMMQLVI
jgi:hypothetical protein